MLALLSTELGGWWVEPIPTTSKGGLLIFPHLHLLYMTQGVFWIFFLYFIQHCFICRPSDSRVSEDAGIEPRLLRLWHW
jgi:hypothetical protein